MKQIITAWAAVIDGKICVPSRYWPMAIYEHEYHGMEDGYGREELFPVQITINVRRKRAKG